MDARTALKNYSDAMIRTYGANYPEHWSEDDKETFEILARNASKNVRMRQRAVRADTSFLRVFMSGKRDAEYVTEQEKIAAWNALVARTGSQIKGTLSPQTGLYDGEQPKHRKIKGVPVPAAPVIAPSDVDSSNIMAYLLGK